MSKVSPSLLAAFPDKIPEAISSLNASSAEFVHIDIMDGRFVPNKTWEADFLDSLKDIKEKVFDVHLMVDNPFEVAPKFAEKGADIITFHLESGSLKDNLNVIDLIHKLQKKAGISIKPGTPIEEIDPYLPYIDLVLIMSVEPGRGGQGFLAESPSRIKYVAEAKKNHSYNYLIEVDGGINEETGKLCRAAGAEVLVAGSYLFGHSDFARRVEALKGNPRE